MRHLLIAVALVFAVATGALADKVLSRTYYTAVLTDVNSVCFVRNSASPTGWRVEANAGVRASDGDGFTATIGANATANQKTTVENFITNNVLAPLNAKEGL